MRLLNINRTFHACSYGNHDKFIQFKLSFCIVMLVLHVIGQTKSSEENSHFCIQYILFQHIFVVISLSKYVLILDYIIKIIRFIEARKKKIDDSKNLPRTTVNSLWSHRKIIFLKILKVIKFSDPESCLENQSILNMNVCFFRGLNKCEIKVVG